MSAEKMILKHAGKIKASDHAYFAIHNCDPQFADDVIDQIVAFVRASGMETMRRPVVRKDKFAQTTQVVMSIHVVLRNHADRQTAIHFVEHHLNQKYGTNMRCKEMGRDIVTYTLSLETTELPEMAELKRNFDEFGRNEIFCTSELITYINYRFFRSAVDAMLAFSSNGSQSEVLPSHPKPVQYTRMMLDLENQLTQKSFGATSDAVETSSSFAAFVEAYHHDTPVRLKQACEKFVRDYFADTQPTDQFLNANATSIISSVLQELYSTPPAAFRDCIQHKNLSTSNIAQLHCKYNDNQLDKSVRLMERSHALKDSAPSKIFEFKAPPVPPKSSHNTTPSKTPKMLTEPSVREVWNKILRSVETRVFGVSDSNSLYCPDIRLRAVERYMLIPMTTTCIKERIKNIDIQIKTLHAVAHTVD